MSNTALTATPVDPNLDVALQKAEPFARQLIATHGVSPVGRGEPAHFAQQLAGVDLSDGEGFADDDLKRFSVELDVIMRTCSASPSA